MKDLKDYLNEKYPSRLSDNLFRRYYFAALLALGLSFLGILDFSVPEVGTEVARRAPPTSLFAFVIICLISGIGGIVMSYMIYKRYKKRREMGRLVCRYVSQEETGENIDTLVEEALFVDELEFHALLDDLSEKGILDDL